MDHRRFPQQVKALLLLFLLFATLTPTSSAHQPLTQSTRGLTVSLQINENGTWVDNTTQPVGTTLQLKLDLQSAIGLALTITAVLPQALEFTGEAHPAPTDTSSNDLNGTNLYWTYDTGGNSRTVTFNVTIIHDGAHTLSGNAVLLLPVKYHQDSVLITGTPIPDTQPPSQVTNLTVEDAHNGKLNLNWDAATDNVAVSHYRIYRNNSFLINHTQTTYQDTGLVNNVTYTYQVSAVDLAGNEGNKSNPANGTPTPKNGDDNVPPTASFRYKTTRYTATFTDQSTDSDGTITSWLWDFGDGSTSTEQNPTHTYENKGPFTVSLTVTDDQGATDTIQESISKNSHTARLQRLQQIKQLFKNYLCFIHERLAAHRTIFSP